MGGEGDQNVPSNSTFLLLSKYNLFLLLLFFPAQ